MDDDKLDEKLDIIFKTLSGIQTSVAVLASEMHAMNNRGCKAAMDAVAEMREKKIEPMEKKIAIAEGIAIIGSVTAAVIASVISYFRGH